MAFGDFTVARAGTKRVLNSSGVLAEVAANVPAFEFNTDGTYRGLLVEPAGTNLILRSEEADNAYWTKTVSTTSANAGVSPSGTTTADKIIPNAGSVAPFLARTITVVDATTYTLSVYVKADGYDWAYISHGAINTSAWFDLQNGVVGTVQASVTRTAIEALPNGWYRIQSTAVTTSTSQTVRLCGVSNADNVSTFTADGTSGVLWWGAQVETGSVATSYIPTVASTANRVADSVTLTGASSLIGTTEGTVYVEAEYRNFTSLVGRRLLNLRVDANTSIGITANTTAGQIEFSVVEGGLYQAQITQSSVASSVVKLAGAYKVNDFAFYYNGAQVGTDVSGTVPDVTSATIGLGIRSDSLTDSQFNGWIRSVALFPTRLSNATLTTLTT